MVRNSNHPLNSPLSIDPDVTEQIPARPLYMEPEDPLTVGEVREATDELQCDKSAGLDGIPPEAFKAVRLKVLKRVVSC